MGAVQDFAAGLIEDVKALHEKATAIHEQAGQADSGVDANNTSGLTTDLGSLVAKLEHAAGGPYGPSDGETVPVDDGDGDGTDGANAPGATGAPQGGPAAHEGHKGTGRGKARP